MAQSFIVLAEKTGSTGPFSPAFKVLGWKELAENQRMSGQRMTELPWEDRKLWDAMCDRIV